MDNGYLLSIFLFEQRKMFRTKDLLVITDSMEKMSDTKINVIVNHKYQNPLMVFFISYFIGYLGIDRFIIGDMFIGLLKLITFGGLGVWYIIDLFIIMNRTKCTNFRNFITLANQIPN